MRATQESLRRLEAMDLLEQMRTFTRVIERGSLSKAARDLRLSLPAVSRQITALEEDLRTPLVLRTTRKLQITDAGRLYYERCLRVLREVEEAQTIARGDKTPRGTVAISAPVTFGLLKINPLVRRLREKYPALEIDLRLEDQMIDLVGEGVDLAIRGGVRPPDSASLIAHTLFRFRRCLFAAPKYLKARGVLANVAALEGHDLLVQRSSEVWRFEEGGEVKVRGILRSNALLALKDAAIAGLGIALLPDWLVHEELEDRRLRRVLPELSTSAVPMIALQRVEHRGSAKINAVLEVLKAAQPAS